MKILDSVEILDSIKECIKKCRKKSFLKKFLLDNFDCIVYNEDKGTFEIRNGSLNFPEHKEKFGKVVVISEYDEERQQGVITISIKV